MLHVLWQIQPDPLRLLSFDCVEHTLGECNVEIIEENVAGACPGSSGRRSMSNRICID